MLRRFCGYPETFTKKRIYKYYVTQSVKMTPSQFFQDNLLCLIFCDFVFVLMLHVSVKFAVNWMLGRRVMWSFWHF